MKRRRKETSSSWDGKRDCLAKFAVKSEMRESFERRIRENSLDTNHETRVKISFLSLKKRLVVVTKKLRGK